MSNLENSKVPQIRFCGYAEEWQEKTLGELFPITSAARVHKHEWVKSGVPFFRSSDVVSAFKGAKNTPAFISHDLYKELSEKVGRTKTGDILVTGGGSIGIPYLVPSDESLYFKDADLLWLKIREAVDSKFLYTFFSSGPFKRYIKSISHVGTIAHYTVEQAKETPLYVPTEGSEQNKIGLYFKELDTLIRLHQHKHKKLVTLKQTMLQKMFPQAGATTPEIRFKGFSHEWVEQQLENIVEVCSGRDYKHLSSGNIPVYGTGGYMLSVDKALSYDKDAIGIGRKGTIDKPYILKCPFWTVDTLFYAIPKKGHNLDFIYSIFQKIDWKKYDESTGVPSLSKTAINEIGTHVPGIEEQQTIGLYFSQLDELVSRHSIQLEKLKQVKAACLEGMFV